jgi:hypothetical protein
MSLTLPDCPKFTVSRTGLIVHEELSFDEWAALAPALGEASRGVAFLIGDWLLYGGQHFGKDDSKPQGRVQSSRYEHAIASTGLDRTTLRSYAYVARHVTAAGRHEALSWNTTRLSLNYSRATSSIGWVSRCGTRKRVPHLHPPVAPQSRRRQSSRGTARGLRVPLRWH